MSGFNHEINCLKDADRNTRKGALQRLETALKSVPAANAQETANLIMKPLLAVFSDAVERNREMAVTIVIEFVPKIDDFSAFITEMTAAIRDRLAPQPTVEASEEVRLLLLNLLNNLLDKWAVFSSTEFEDLVHAVDRSVQDQFPEAKKLSSSILVKLAKLHPARLDGYVPQTVRSLLGCLTHQQAKVRSSALQALASVVICHSDKAKIVRETAPHLRKFTDDRNSQVREELLALAAFWIVTIEEEETKLLLPILMSGINDEMPNVQDIATKMMEQTGSVYLQRYPKIAEAEDDIPAEHPEAVFQGKARAGKGARKLVQSHVGELVKPLITELGEWTATQRWKAVDVITAISFYSEHAISQYPEILAPIARALADNEKKVSERALICATVVGAFFNVETFVAVITSALRGTGLTPQLRACWIQLLSIMMQSSHRCNPERSRTEISVGTCMMAIGNMFADGDNCHSESVEVQEALLGAVQSLVQTAGSGCELAAQAIFDAILRLQSLNEMPHVVTKAKDVALSLAAVLGIDYETLYRRHSDALLKSLVAKHKTWQTGSNDVVLFSTLMKGATSNANALLEMSIPVFKEAANASRDADVRVQILALLKYLAEESDANVAEAMKPFVTVLVTQVLLPCCVWHVGRVSVVVRKAAVSVLKSLFFRAGLMAAEDVQSWIAAALPVWASILEDDDPDVRFLACQLSYALFQLLRGRFTDEQVRTIWIELLKRLDDSNDRIRIEVAKAWTTFLPNIPRNYESAQFDYLLRGMIVHLDDSNEHVQDAMEAPLKEAAAISPKEFIEIVSDVKPRHRTPYRCDDLIAYAQSIIQ